MFNNSLAWVPFFALTNFHANYSLSQKKRGNFSPRRGVVHLSHTSRGVAGSNAP